MKSSFNSILIRILTFITAIVMISFNAYSTQPPKKALAILGDNWHCVAPLHKHIVRNLEVADYKTDVIIEYDIPFERLDEYDLVLISRYAWDDARRFREHAMGTPKAKEMRWISPADEILLEEFVKKGGSLFLHHDGIGDYPEEGGMRRLAKANFINHPPIGKITLKPTGKMPELTKGVEEFTLVDEEYNLTINEADTQVFLESFSEANGRYPQGWAHEYGSGKVVVFVPGHGWESLGHPMVERSIKNIINWLGK
jgi:hypothetical protein